MSISQDRPVVGPLPGPAQATALPPPPPPPPTALPPPPASVGGAVAAQPGIFWLAVAAAAAMVVGALGPWATALGFVELNGTRGDGWIVIGAAVLALVALYNHATRGSRTTLVFSALLGAAGAVIGAIDLNDISTRGSGEILGQRVDVIEPAWGIYLVIAGSVALVICSLVLRSRKTDREFPPGC